MKLDHCFFATGAAVFCLVAWRAFRGRAALRQTWSAYLLWACFGAGLLAQGLVPHLSIRGDRFVMPSHPGSAALHDPAGYVERARRMYLLSALLTTGATLGLALRYRQSLFQPVASRSGAHNHRKPVAS